MHNNFYFLRQLTLSLEPILKGATIVACFSQEKDELVLEVSTKTNSSFFLKAMLTSWFSALSFPEYFNRAKANSVNIFPDIIGEQITGIVQHNNERSFHLQLTNQKVLLFKLFGNRSNLVYFHQNKVDRIFHKKYEKDYLLDYTLSDRPFLLNKDYFLNNISAPEKIIPTFGDLPGIYLKTLNYNIADPDQKWNLVMQVKEKLEKPEAFYIIKYNHQTRLSLLPVGEIKYEFDSPLLALNKFVSNYLAEYHFEHTFKVAYNYINRKLKSSLIYLDLTQSKLKTLLSEASYSQTADIIMANLTNIPERAEKVILYDFYQDKERLIQLKQKETPQKFAERLYKKGKNQQIEIKLLQDRIKSKEEEVLELEILLQELTSINDYKTLKAFVKANPLVTEKPQSAEEEPFRIFHSEGFKIMVGKSAKNNDVLTQQFTFKEDLWLHAKDVPGSHVVIKYQAGKTFPQSVLLKAAQLAAFYSKRKTDSICPVLYTPKKYVRKSKGSAPGQVIVEREKVLLVEPGNPFENKPYSNIKKATD